MDRNLELQIQRLRAKLGMSSAGGARKPRASKKHVVGWKIKSQNETTYPCAICGEDVDTTVTPGPGGPAYMDGWHHWDCLDAHNGVVRDAEGNRVEGDGSAG